MGAQMTRIAVLDDWQNVARAYADWSALPKGAELVVFNDHLRDAELVAERLKDFDVVCIMRERTPFPRAMFERLPKLRLLVSTGPRNASIDLAAAKERGVTVCGTSSTGHPTAELAWGLILGLARRIAFEDRAVREGRWQSTIGVDMKGKRLGVIGLGRLGSRVAAVGRAFEMDVVAWSQNLTAERAAEAGVRLVAKDELLRTADVVSLHLVLSPRSRGVIGAAELALMKPSALLVNTSRGPLIDEAALIAALRERRISGAGLDVYDEEPLPADHPLRRLDNVLLTPHLGYVTEDTYRAFYGETVEAIVAFLAGAPVRVMG
jgi:phosphoglycerate dehydrogenase-like enzyme